MIYTTVIHFLRRAYNLSLNEYCVLDAIQTLSGNQKFDGWCVASQQHIAEELDLSRDTVQRAYTSLEAKGLIVRRKSQPSDTSTRPSDEWLEVRNADKGDMVFILEKNGIKLGSIPQKFNNVTLTAKTDRPLPQKPTDPYRKNRQTPTAKTDTIITSDNNKIIDSVETKVSPPTSVLSKEPTRVFQICDLYYKVLTKLSAGEPVSLTTKDSAFVSSFIARHGKAAKLLTGYTNEQIKRAMGYCNRLANESKAKGDGNGWDWTLETVGKKIDQVSSPNQNQYE